MVGEAQAISWSVAYLASNWFRDIYRIYTIDNVDPTSVSPYATMKALSYRVDILTEVLWKHY